jgi:hypothetical protein
VESASVNRIRGDASARKDGLINSSIWLKIDHIHKLIKRFSFIRPDLRMSGRVARP